MKNLKTAPAGIIPLFEDFPRLGEALPRIPLGCFPTPVEEVPAIADAVGVGRFFVKRDDLTHPDYGGNKVRKLEFLLAEAERRGAKKLMTFGGIGSNHALATTIHGAGRGFSTISVLAPQPVTPEVKKNLLAGHHFGAELHVSKNEADVIGVSLSQMARSVVRDGKAPYVVPPGGSSTLGAVGYVNAALELKRQVDEGLLPEPDRIYVAVGTCGTAAGLMLGCAVAGLKTRVVGVKVTEWFFGNPVNFAGIAGAASLKLHGLDRDFPLKVFSPAKVELLTEFFGGEYGKHTPEGTEAVELMEEHAGLRLEGVYTGKTMAGLIGSARNGDMAGATVLYWHTYNSADVSKYSDGHDYHELPGEFHKFFEMHDQI